MMLMMELWLTLLIATTSRITLSSWQTSRCVGLEIHMDKEETHIGKEERLKMKFDRARKLKDKADKKYHKALNRYFSHVNGKHIGRAIAYARTLDW